MMLAQGSSTIFSPSNMKLFIYGSIVVIMIVGRIIKAAKEAAEKKRIEDAIKQAELEALRTGRPVPAATAPAQDMSAEERLRELARKREREIRSSRSEVSVVANPQQGTGVSGIPSPVRQPGTQKRQDRRTQPARKGAPTPPPNRKVMEAATTVSELANEHESTTHRLVPDAKPASTVTSDSAVRETMTSRQDLRTAIVLREVLDPPMCLRD